MQIFFSGQPLAALGRCHTVRDMFINWLKLTSRDVPDAQHGMFVEKVSEPRKFHPVDGFVAGGWSLILLKCVLASVAIHHWAIPIGDFYVWVPSLIFGGLCTSLYLTRETDDD